MISSRQGIEGKKALHIIPYPAVPAIGPCFRAIRQLKALRRSGMEVFLVSPKVHDERLLEQARTSLFEGITVMPDLINSGFSFFREAGFFLFSGKRLKKIIEMIRPDIVQVHNPPDTLAFTSSAICRRLGVPLVYDIHDSSLEVIGASEFNPVLKKIYGMIALYFERKIIQRCSGIVTVSDSLKKLLRSSREELSDKRLPIVVMRNIEDNIDILLKKNTEKEGDYIFYSGTLYAKFIGIEFLILSVKELLKRENIKFFIAGDGPYRKRLEAFIRDQKCSGLIIMLGRVEKKQAIEYAAGARLTVIPYEQNSLTEIALPNKLFEYMALGKAVVYPDFPGFREVLGSDNPGKYTAGEGNALLKVVTELLTNDALRKETGQRNREIVQKFTFEKEFSHLLALYETVFNEFSVDKKTSIYNNLHY